MNTRLFRSWHAAVAALVVVAFVGWAVAAGLPLGRTVGYERAFLVATGWTAFALFSIVLAHVLRKYVHKLGISPEFRSRVPIDRLEAAETELNAIRRKMNAKALTAESDILRAARAALKQHRVQKILRVEVRPSELDGTLQLLALPTFPLGKMWRWMQAHLYYGLAAGVLVLLHAGNGFGPGIGAWLEGLALFVVLSGVVGAFSWAAGPARLTSAERELSAEKAVALEYSLRVKIENLRRGLDEGLREQLEELDEARADFDERARAIATGGTAQVQDVLALMGQRQRALREVKRLMRVRLQMHLWRILHIPAAIVLFVLVLVHVVSVYNY